MVMIIIHFSFLIANITVKSLISLSERQKKPLDTSQLFAAENGSTVSRFNQYFLIVNSQSSHFLTDTLCENTVHYNCHTAHPANHPLSTRRELLEQCSSVSSLSVSANLVSTRSPEGCGALGLEKAPIDSGISQGALFVVIHPVGRILNSVPPTDSPRMTLTPQQSF